MPPYRHSQINNNRNAPLNFLVNASFASLTLLLILSIGTCNIRSALNSHKYLNRIADNCDVIALTEHWLTENTQTYFKPNDPLNPAVSIRSTQHRTRVEGEVAILVKVTCNHYVSIHKSRTDGISAVHNNISAKLICRMLSTMYTHPDPDLKMNA